jgi:predicted RNase H-like HicB family nuclease
MTIMTQGTIRNREGLAMPAVHYDSSSAARANFKDLLDAASKGQVATIRRDSGTAAVLDAARLRHFLTAVVPSQAKVVAEAGGWSVFIPGLPLAADGDTLDDALTDMIEAVREYAHDWQDRLLNAPNHRDNWSLVQLIELSSDDELRAWLRGVPQ